MTPAFTASCTPSLRPSPWSSSFPIHPLPRPSRRPRTARFSMRPSHEEEDPSVLPLHPASAPSFASSPSRRADYQPVRNIDDVEQRANVSPLVTSVSLNLNGRAALPSIASLKRYMNDLRPKLDYLEPHARERVLSALEVANVAHQGQKRKSGEPFIIHPIAVAAILADMRMDRDCIIAGLLHDTVEDTPMTLDELEILFGKDVAKIVEGETKLTKLAKNVQSQTDESLLHDALSQPIMPSWQKERQKREDEQQKQADNLRAMFLAMTEDVRVIIVKLADRLHNMRTLAHMSVAKQRKTAKETLEFFAPLAHRLGMRRIKSELEELSFMYLHPDEYQLLKYEVETMLTRSKFNYYLQSAEEIVKDVLEQDRILHNMIRSVDVKGSTKELYSIYKRMQAGENLSSMLDIATLRVVVDLDPGVDSNQACYHVLGRIHNLWKPLPKRLKDYIAFPKPNGYQSLHTTVLLGQKFDFFGMEIQIRTAQMHRIAEEGIAAELFNHGSARKSLSFNPEEEIETGANTEWRRRTKGWLISIREYIEEFSSSRDLIDAVRKDLLGNRVFVFTPKGRIVDLPKDSTPIDVAYRIHSDVGSNMIGAKVNGRTVGFDYKLQNADVVRIISSPCSPGPSSEWVSYAKSRTARQKIRQFLRAKNRDNLVDRGRRMLEDAARAFYEPIPSEAGIIEIMPRLSAILSASSGTKEITTVEDLYLTIAKQSDENTKFPLQTTVLSILRDRRHSAHPSVATSSSPKISSTKQARSLISSGILPESPESALEGYEAVLSPCCYPIRGDKIAGVYVPRGNGKKMGLLVHRVGCHHMSQVMCRISATNEAVNLKWAVKPRELDDVFLDEENTTERIHFSQQRTAQLPNRSAKETPDAYLAARVVTVARDCTGLLSYVSGVLASMGTSIRRAATVSNSETMLATLAFEVLVRDTYHLRQIIERIEECDEVQSTKRLDAKQSLEYFPNPDLICLDDDVVNIEDELTAVFMRDGQSVSPTELELAEDEY